MKLIFWQPFLSFHQEGFYRALIREPWVDSVVFRVESNLPPERKRAGWREVDARGLLVEPIVAECVPELDEDVIHFFTGFGTHPLIWNAFDRIPIHADCRVFAYTEAPDLTGAAGVLRRWKYSFMAPREKQALFIVPSPRKEKGLQLTEGYGLRRGPWNYLSND